MEIKVMINSIMNKKNINQQQLANLLNVSESQISRWIDGAVPKIENLRKVKKLYDEVVNENNKHIS